MANFLGLPRELWQNIIFLALKDAAFQDIRFSDLQLCFAWNIYEPLTRLQSPDYQATIETICALNAHEMAIKLVSVDSQLHSDLMYPLGLILPNFENLTEDGSDVIDTLERSLTRRECLELRYDRVHRWEAYASREREGMWCQNMTEELKLLVEQNLCCASPGRETHITGSCPKPPHNSFTSQPTSTSPQQQSPPNRHGKLPHSLTRIAPANTYSRLRRCCTPRSSLQQLAIHSWHPLAKQQHRQGPLIQNDLHPKHLQSSGDSAQS